MKRTTPIWLIGAATLALAACNQETFEAYPCERFCPDDTGADVGTDTADVAPSGRTVGFPCATDSDCEAPTGQCVNATLLGSFGLALDVPNGFCSVVSLAGEPECGEEGVAFNTEPFSGIGAFLCLQECEESADCRWQEGYTCYELVDVDPELDGAVCIPGSLETAIECNDAHCDINSDGDVDADGEPIWDYKDNCPAIDNGDQADSDGDGLGDACDPVDDSE